MCWVYQKIALFKPRKQYRVVFRCSSTNHDQKNVLNVIQDISNLMAKMIS